MVPTTLLAQVDSSVGGKVGINHPNAKNIIGAFHQPVGVWIDTNSLSTLPDRELRCGLAEVVKYGVILDAEFFATLEQIAEDILGRDHGALKRIILRCCEIKASVVAADEREETGMRAMLNFGHTIGHAIEATAGYDGALQARRGGRRGHGRRVPARGTPGLDQKRQCHRSSDPAARAIRLANRGPGARRRPFDRGYVPRQEKPQW